MSENGRSRQSAAVGAGVVLVAVIVLHVLARVLSFPSLDIGVPDLPDVPGWVRKLLKIKNWALLGIAILVVIGFVAGEIEKHRAGRPPGAPDAEQ
jgi:uncharacterized protein involved in cysteine biosynthesis